MRLLVMLVPVLLGLPAPVCAQVAERDDLQEEIVAADPEDGGGVEDAGPRAERASGRSTAAPAASERHTAGAAAAQPTMRNFLYQVFLAAVTALVTALIWKAVF